MTKRSLVKIFIISKTMEKVKPVLKFKVIICLEYNHHGQVLIISRLGGLRTGIAKW